MKFGKRIRAVVDQSYEEWRPMFMSYKDLKKILSASLSPSSAQSSEDNTNHTRSNDTTTHSSPPTPLLSPALSARNTAHHNDVAVKTAQLAKSQFFTRFRAEVEKVNEFFLDKQEDYIIEHQQLTAKMNQMLQPAAATRQQLIHLRQRLTNFHGQLVLLDNFSTVNYTGFRKILKKHDKKTGLNVRNVYLKTVLITPFFLSDTVPQLIRTTESQLAQLDSVQKFRRTTSTSATDTFNLNRSSPPPVPSSQVTPIHVPSKTVHMSTSSPDLHPRPHAFISPCSSLWRFYHETRVYAARVQEALQSSEPCIPLPSPMLSQLLDSVHPSELGIHSSFVSSVPTACDYRIATDTDFAMGFFVFGPGTQLQFFNVRGATVTRNLHGRVRLRCFETVRVQQHADGAEQRTAADPARDPLVVRETRRGVTNGPWPAVTTHANAHVQWTPETQSAVFYVTVPSKAVERLARYRLRPHEHSTFSVLDEGECWPITQVFS